MNSNFQKDELSMKRFSWLNQWLHRATRTSSGRRSVRRSKTLVSAQMLEPRVVLAAPTLGALTAVTLQAGAPFIVPLNGADTDNQPLTLTATSSNVAVTTEIPTGNRTLKMDITNFGSMTFQLFEDRAPRVTNHIISLATSDFYNGSIFHRVFPTFVIQGGDPLGNPPGTGGSNLGEFDDQFNVDLQHTRTGLLSMAKTTDDTNDSQFFVTEGPQRHLDFNHSIFGMLTTGESVREAISSVPTNGSNLPTTPVVVSNMDVINDTQNGVLILKAPIGTTGTSTITVTVTDPDGNSSQQTFVVTVIADTTNNAPFLADVPKLRTLANTALNFEVQAIDVENDAAFFLDQDVLASNSLFNPFTAPANLPYTVDFDTGAVSVTPQNGLTGLQSFTVATGATPSAIDYQVANINIVAMPGPLTVTGADHPSVNPSNDGRPDAFSVVRNGDNLEVRINGELSVLALADSVTTLTLVGSNDNDTFTIDGSGGNPFSSGGINIDGGTGTDEVRIGNNGTGPALANVTHNFTNTISGNSSFEGVTLTYSAIEELVDTTVAVNRTLTFGVDGNAIQIIDDTVAANGRSRVTSGSSVPITFTAPTGSLAINGGAGNDTLQLLGVDSLFTITPVLQGGDNHDVLVGGPGADSLEGGIGDDVFIGNGGNDTFNGGAGTDKIFETGDVSFVLGATTLTGNGTDTFSLIELAELTGGVSANTINAAAFGGPVTLSGGSGNDSLTGSGQDDQLNGGSGNDTVLGGAGRDAVTGGSGADSILGGDGIDAVFGGTGNDTIDGGLGNDVLNGQDNDDSILGGGDNDKLTGAAGNDVIDGGLGDDTLNGDAGLDTLFGRDGADLLVGGDDNDRLEGEAGADRLRGEKGLDLLLGGAGADNMSGGADADSMDGGEDNDSLFGDFGDDTVLGGAGDDLLRGHVGADSIDGGDGTGDKVSEEGDTNFTINGLRIVSVLFGDEAPANIERFNLAGGAGNNVIDGRLSTLKLLLNGLGGNDTLLGGAFIDNLFGGDGDDVLSGGASNDALDGGSGVDRVQETADVNFVLTNTQLVGLGTDVLTTIETVSLTGGIGANNLDATAFTLGAVTLNGGAGNDTLNGGSGNDSLQGNEDADLINGNLGNDMLFGGTGNDSLNGGNGNDIANGGDGDDAINGGNDNDGLAGFTGNDNIVGGSGDDTIYGGVGNDVLLGGGGSDTVFGGDGSDVVTGQSSADTLVGDNGGPSSVADAGDSFGFEAAEHFETFLISPLPVWVNQV